MAEIVFKLRSVPQIDGKGLNVKFETLNGIRNDFIEIFYKLGLL